MFCYIHSTPPICFGHNLWSFSGRCHTKNILQKCFEPMNIYIYMKIIFKRYVLIYIHIYMADRGSTKLRCCATNRKVAGSIPAGVSGFFVHIKSFRSHYGPRVDSASNRNEYQEYFLGVKAAGA